jgi:hypothetical protein
LGESGCNQAQAGYVGSGSPEDRDCSEGPLGSVESETEESGLSQP